MKKLKKILPSEIEALTQVNKYNIAIIDFMEKRNSLLDPLVKKYGKHAVDAYYRKVER